jgi:type I restriction enzyme M protein
MTDITDAPTLLRAIRAKLDLTQEQLADRLGVSFATINRWEGGVNKPQKAAQATIAALATEAGVEMNDSGTDSDSAAAQVTRRRRGTQRAATPSTKTMEQMLWDAACSIRGEKDAARFKDFLLPLLFLKRLSDVFDDEIDRLAEEYGDRDLALEIAEGDHALLRFYLPPQARWAVINGREPYAWPTDVRGHSTRPRDIGEHLTRAVRAVVRHNPSLAGVIDLEDFAAERNGERDINPAKLRGVVETFSDPRYRLGLADVQPDFLGRAYEYLLRKFAEGSGQSAGEFFTPTEVGFLMAHILRPRPGEDCHDYACGSAGLLVKLQLVARELDPTSRIPLKLYGQELTAESYAVARMNAIIHDMSVEMARGDSMINPKFKAADSSIRTFDIVIANPMWNQPFNTDLFKDDPFDRFRTRGGVTSGKGDWAWLQHTVACLNARGRAAVVLDTGAVTRGSGSKNEDKERNIRKWFVDQDLIDGVILLPDNLFYNTTAAGVIVVLSKRKPAARKDRILLLNASRRVLKGRPKNYVPEDAIRPLAEAYRKGEPVPGEIAVITRQQAEEADYNLSPSRWVGARERQGAGAGLSARGAIPRRRSRPITHRWLDRRRSVGYRVRSAGRGLRRPHARTQIC